MPPKVPLDRKAVAGLCWRHHVRRLALFGSVPRDGFTPASDVDVLVAPREGAPSPAGSQDRVEQSLPLRDRQEAREVLPRLS